MSEVPLYVREHFPHLLATKRIKPRQTCTLPGPEPAAGSSHTVKLTLDSRHPTPYSLHPTSYTCKVSPFSIICMMDFSVWASA